LADAAGLSS